MTVRSGSLPLITSIAAVMGASSLQPLVGACGTVHSLVVTMMSAAILQMAFVGNPPGFLLTFAKPLFIGINTALFAIPAIILHARRSPSAGDYQPLLTGWLLLFLASYFLLLPTTDCP